LFLNTKMTCKGGSSFLKWNFFWNLYINLDIIIYILKNLKYFFRTFVKIFPQKQSLKQTCVFYVIPFTPNDVITSWVVNPWEYHIMDAKKDFWVLDKKFVMWGFQINYIIPHILHNNHDPCLQHWVLRIFHHPSSTY